MPTLEEITIFWNALKSNVLGFWGGILGLIFTAIWIFREKAPMKRVFLSFFVSVVFLSLGSVWLDEYRSHKETKQRYEKPKGKSSEPSAPDAAIYRPHVKIAKSFMGVEDGHKVVWLEIKNFGNIGTDIRGKVILRANENLVVETPLSLSLPPNDSSKLKLYVGSVEFNEPLFDDMFSGKWKATLDLDVDYKGLSGKSYPYIYRSQWEPRIKFFYILEER